MATDDWFAEIRREYAATLPSKLEAIRGFAVLGDAGGAGLLRALHQLGGSAGSHGFQRVGDVARSWERALREGDASCADRHLGGLTDAIAEAVTAAQ